MLDNIKALRRGDLDRVDDKMLYPILRWLSGSMVELPWCAEVNRSFWWLPSDIAKGYIYVGLRDQSKFIKYPKAPKTELSNSETRKKGIIKEFHGWSEQEYQRNLGVLNSIDWNEIAISLGLDDKDRKILGLAVLKDTVKKPEPPKPKSLFDFV